jgi:hypothetical protein
LEVLLATAIFLGCVIVLAQLTFIGRQHATDADELGNAQRLCHNKVNEILAGLSPAFPVENELLEEEAGWVYSIALTSLFRCGVVEMRVTVSQDPETTSRPRSFTLVRWLDSVQAAKVGEIPAAEEMEEETSNTEPMSPEEEP